MKVSLKYLFEILKYFSVVDLNQLFGIAKENLMNFLTSWASKKFSMGQNITY